MQEHHHSRSAEPTLEAMLLVEGLLNGMQVVASSQTFDRRDFGAVGLDGENRT